MSAGDVRRRLRDRARRAIGVERLGDELERLRLRVDELEAMLFAPPHVAEGQSLLLGSNAEGLRWGFEGRRTGESYAGFEDVFRGTQAFIRDRQRRYLTMLPDDGLVVDLGCGRGEMLDLLAESGRTAIGVDLDEEMASQCRARGHEVVQADARAFLAGLGPGSAACVFSAQFLEHVPPTVLPELLRESLRVLRPGGLLVAETVNPHSLPALRTFHVDLTHEKPLFPEVMLVLSQQAGFERGEIRFPLGTGDLERDRRTCGEYALLAWAPGSQASSA